MKKFLILILIFTFAFSTFSEEKKKDKTENKSKKNENKFRFYFLSKSDARVGFIDKDNTDQINLYLNKNEPKLDQRLYSFFKFKINKDLYFGPYFNTDFTARWDYKNTYEKLTYEKIFQEFDSGIKFGYDFGKGVFKDSEINFTLPFYANYDLRYDKKGKQVFLKQDKNYGFVYEFGSRLFIGAKPAFNLVLKSKKNYLTFKYSNVLQFACDLYNQNYILGYDGFDFATENKTSFSIAPFNFINDKIDINLLISEEFIFSYNVLNCEIENEAYFEIKWSGFDYIHLGHKPIIYKFELTVPTADAKNAYNQFQLLSSEFWVEFRYKFFSFNVAYEFPYFCLDKGVINKDSVKPHYVTASLKFDIQTEKTWEK
ncbi:MAG TPA: hypothetical protein PLO89_09255 [Spirochaetota bacterium]|nr:hypothetical protein [Spirochaetota bacterium]